MANGLRAAPDFTLICTVFNEGKTIIDFLNSFRNQSLFPKNLIIVDGGSTDNTVELIQNFSVGFEYPIKLIIDRTCSKEFSKAPIAKGRNIAIANVITDFVISTDAGCVLDKNFINEIAKPFEDPSVDVVGGGYRHQQINKFADIYYQVAMTKTDKVDASLFLPSSRSVAFKKACWELVGGYPEISYTGEDSLFMINLKSANFNFYLNREAMVFWRTPLTFKEARKKQRQYGLGDGESLIFAPTLIRLLIVVIPIVLLGSPNHRKYFWYSYCFAVCHLSGFIEGVLNRAFRQL